MIQYNIYLQVRYDSKGYWEKPEPSWTNISNPQEALRLFKSWGHNGEILRSKGNLYEGPHDYRYLIYAIDHDLGIHGRFYDIADLIRDKIRSGEWDKMTKEQQELLLKLR